MTTVSDSRIRGIIRNVILEQQRGGGRGGPPSPEQVATAKKINAMLRKSNIQGEITGEAQGFTQRDSAWLEGEIEKANQRLPSPVARGGTERAPNVADQGLSGGDDDDRSPQAPKVSSDAAKGTNVDTGAKDLLFDIELPLNQSPNKGTMDFVLRVTGPILQKAKESAVSYVKGPTFSKNLAKEVGSHVPDFPDNGFLEQQSGRAVISQIAEKLNSVETQWQEGALRRALKDGRTLEDLYNKASISNAGPQLVAIPVLGALFGPIGVVVGGVATYIASNRQMQTDESGKVSDADILSLMRLGKGGSWKYHFHDASGPGGYSLPPGMNIPGIGSTGDNGRIVINMPEYLRRISGADSGYTVGEYREVIKEVAKHEFYHQISYATMSTLIENFPEIAEENGFLGTGFTLNKEQIGSLIDLSFVNNEAYARKKLKDIGYDPEQFSYYQQYLGSVAKNFGFDIGVGGVEGDSPFGQVGGGGALAVDTGALETRERIKELADELPPNPTVADLRTLMDSGQLSGSVLLILKPSSQMSEEDLSAITGVLAESNVSSLRAIVRSLVLFS